MTSLNFILEFETETEQYTVEQKEVIGLLSKKYKSGINREYLFTNVYGILYRVCREKRGKLSLL